ncbi:MAG: indole-3-glycerol phosphate synthase TrpC [Pseudomonadales bacterium]|nr:indole-3-glycerol phosphate synthase TrpC [Pseudomonadales bacterium]MCP5184373.1 indole-3-glycerol phosphate synthase TrpC [Pseudomonadales bacterium]
MSTILDRILAHKHREVAVRREHRSLDDLLSHCRAAPPTRGFVAAMQRSVALGRAAVIAEIKRASPSKGLIRENFVPSELAQSYERGGATCLSVLTDEQFFQGSDNFLIQARDAVTLPVLRKDFVVDRYQLAEARCLGADCVLLIVAALESSLLGELYNEALELGLDALIEVHDEAEMATALTLKPALVGVNNRNLKTFDVSLDNSVRLKSMVPDGTLLVAESGIHTHDDVARLRSAGIHGFLVGEAFMRADDPGARLRELFA